MAVAMKTILCISPFHVHGKGVVHPGELVTLPIGDAYDSVAGGKGHIVDPSEHADKLRAFSQKETPEPTQEEPSEAVGVSTERPARIPRNKQ